MENMSMTSVSARRGMMMMVVVIGKKTNVFSVISGRESFLVTMRIVKRRVERSQSWI